MRNLVVCLDGTWNTPDQKDQGRQVPSNVVKMARAMKMTHTSTETAQLVYYHSGVGTGGRLDKIIGGMTGQGITNNILDAYRWLVETYEDGDNIYLFGFSRGAYTARSLAGLVGVCGLPKMAANDDRMPGLLAAAKKAYRSKNKETRSKLAKTFKIAYTALAGRIHFVGVWDTVGALGVPTAGPLGWWTRWRSGFHDVMLGSHITHACHAVAINERRGPFKPTLWSPENLTEHQTLQQVWFPGVHSNVGGGYVDCGLSDRAFLWMLSRAYKCGLKTDDTYVNLRIKPNWFGELRSSMSWVYRLMFWDLPADRPIGVVHAASEYLHISAAGRWHHVSTPEDAPGNFTLAHGKVPEAGSNTWEKDFNIR